MARLPRLAVAGQLVQALQRGHDGEAVFRDADDARALLSALREAAAATGSRSMPMRCCRRSCTCSPRPNRPTASAC